MPKGNVVATSPLLLTLSSLFSGVLQVTGSQRLSFDFRLQKTTGLFLSHSNYTIFISISVQTKWVPKVVGVEEAEGGGCLFAAVD